MVRTGTIMKPSRIVTPKPPKEQATEEKYILVLGASGSGKSTFINAVSNSTLRVGSGISTSSEKVEISLPFFIDGQCFRLVDTSAFDVPSKSDTDVLNTIASFLASEYTNGRKLSGIIYIHSIASTRISSTSRRNFTMFQKLAGRKALRNSAIVTTRWDEAKPSTATLRETELKKSSIVKYFVDNGTALFRYDRKLGVQPAQDVIRHFISVTPIPLLVQREMVDEGKLVSETTAGIELHKDLRKQMEKHHDSMRDLKQEFHTLKSQNDIPAARAVRQDMIALKATFDKTRDDCKKLVAIKAAPTPMRILVSPTPVGQIASTSSAPAATAPVSRSALSSSRKNSFSSIPALPPAPPAPIITSTPMHKGKSRDVSLDALPTQPPTPAQVTFTRPRAPSFSRPPQTPRPDSGRPRRNSAPQLPATRVHHHSSRSSRRRPKDGEGFDDLRMLLFVGILLLVLAPVVQRARAF